MEPGEYALMDDAEGRMWWYRALHARIADAVDGVRGRVLDAGCGTGGLLARLRERPDLALYGLEYAAAAAPRAAAKSGARIVRGSINALPFADASFAAVVSADVLCHRAVAPAVALVELRRVLAPGGLLVLNMPAYQWLLSAHDRQVHNIRRTTAGALARDLAASGFTQVRTRYWNTLLLPLMVLQRKVLARAPAEGGETMSDVAAFPPLIDATFHALTELERRLGLSAPAGGSILATARKPGAAA
ncbi:MAG: class I SAM-dependent methyltransferase [Acetobacteraceae bacterium]|nr:class I SAM-dependent methyltransferase [Acetobacteraceae bacterium]